MVQARVPLRIAAGPALEERRGVNAFPDEPTLDTDAPLASPSARLLTDLFVFHLRGRAYALPAAAVEQVAAAPAPVPVPTAPAHVAGVVHLRGRILTVIDLAAALGLDEGGASGGPHRRLIVVAAWPHPWAFVADATVGVRAVTGATTDEDDAGPVRSHAVLDGDAVTVLDLDALVGDLTAAGADPGSA